MKGEDLTVLEQTTQLTRSQAFVPAATLTISLKNMTSEVKFSERKSALLQNNTCEKKSAFCSVLQGNPTVASPKEQLYEQTTSNPAFTERNTQKANAYLLDSRPEQKSFTYHTSTELVCKCLACQ